MTNDLMQDMVDYFIEDGDALVAERYGKQIGIIATKHHYDDRVELVTTIAHWWVDPFYRGCEVGKDLMDTVLATSPGKVVFSVAISSELTENTMNRFGFKPEFILYVRDKHE